MQSCGGSRRVVDNTPNTNVTDTTTTSVVTQQDPVVVEDTRNAPKKSFFEKLKVNLSENENFTPMQKSLIDKASSMESKSVYFLVLEEDGVEVDIVMDTNSDGSQGLTRIMMSVDDIEKINNKYRMAEILEELVKKYNIENDLNLTIVESLTNEVILLNEKVLLLNDELRNKDQIIITLQRVIVELEESNNILSAVNGKQAEVIKAKDKEIKRQKRQKVFIAGGAGVVIMFILLIAF